MMFDEVVHFEDIHIVGVKLSDLGNLGGHGIH